MWNPFKKKPKKIDPPEEYGIIKVNEVAKESGVIDDENRIIEIHSYGNIKELKYSEADVESLQEQGIPIVNEELTDEYDFIEGTRFGEITYRK